MKPLSAKSCPACGERYEGEVLFCPKDGTPLANPRSSSFQTTDGDAYLGIEVGGQIRIKHLIGIGSMGRVYRAFQAGIERDVAVKVLHRELSGNAELVGRFHREAKVASRLVHPNVVQVLMTGTVPMRADPRIGGEMYLVMEHLDGISLLSALAAAGNTGDTAALPLPRALHIVLQLCDAVGEAHVQGIVHRDLKPENVMLVRRGEDPDYVKVLDFGIARFDWANQSMATQAGLIFGTAKYISPEGAAGESVGPPADVYSIATILYQCLAGRAPFEDESPVALLVQHTHTTPPELRSIPRASYVPAPIAEVVMQNLLKKPSARAQDARAFGRDLVAAMRASGLDPDEIIAHSTLIVRGAVRLASHARTRSMDMTPELAKVIAQASKAPPLPAPPAPSASPSPTLVDEPVPSPDSAHDLAERPPAPAAAAGAILAGVRATDTMVVHASELYDVTPPPLPSPPPPEEAAPERMSADSPPLDAQKLENTSRVTAPSIPEAENTSRVTAPSIPEAENAARPAAPSIPEAENAARAAAPSIPEAEIAARAAAPSIPEAENAARAAAPSIPEAGNAARAAAPSIPALENAARAAAPSIPEAENAARAAAPSIPEAENAARPAAPSIPEISSQARPSAPSNPDTGAPALALKSDPDVVAFAPAAPSLRTLFDAPVPEAVSAPPPMVAAEGLAPVAPERPGGTQVGPSPFEGDSIDTSIPPAASRPSAPSVVPVPPAPKNLPRSPELDWNDRASKPATAFQSTIQGAAVESPPEPPGRRSQLSRALGIIVIAAAAAAVAVGVGQYFGNTHAAESSDSVDDLVEQARECVRMRTWDSPPGANVKDITARALEQSPNDPRVVAVRVEAAEKIITDALGKKYSGHRDDAHRLAALALEFEPTNVTAQGLVKELASERQADDASAAASASAAATDDPDAKVTDQPAASGKPVAPKGSAKPSLPVAGGSAQPTAKGSAAIVGPPAKTGKPVTPPTPGTGPAVLPQPTNTGPWL